MKPILEFLNNPDSYSHQPDQIEWIQTHASHLFICPPFVYKLKKPHNLGFLDFSTLEKRKAAYEAELSLNRRLCENVYLDVVPVFKPNGGFIIGETSTGATPVDDTPVGDTSKESSAEGNSSLESRPDHRHEPVEYLLKMRYMNSDHFLINLIREGRYERRHLDLICETLVRFYKSRKPDDETLEYGKREQIQQNCHENFQQTESFVAETISPLAYRIIRRFSDSFLERGRHLFDKRIREKRIVDGHGDLHLEHIHISGQNICIYDCIEFNERFRRIDIAADLAFLAMDLDFHQLSQEGRYFLNRMAEELEDPDLVRMADFYRYYRAYVRGKVKSIESRQPDVTPENRRSAAEAATRYFRLALLYTLFGSIPRPVIVMGRVASGKSTVAGNLSDLLNLACFSTDRIRKQLAGIPETHRVSSPRREELYHPSRSEQTYQTLLESGLAEIRMGRSVILDGTFGKRAVREKTLAFFRKHQTEPLFVEVTAPEEIRKQRLASRSNRPVISDARLNDLELLDQIYSEPDPTDLRLIQLVTDQPSEAVLEEFCEQVLEMHLTTLFPQTQDPN